MTNNIPAYEEFVHALDDATMMNGTELTGTQNDTRGVCATGYVYEFGIYNDGKLVKELWTSSCSSAHGSLNAKSKILKSLFISQIPAIKNSYRKTMVKKAVIFDCFGVLVMSGRFAVYIMIFQELSEDIRDLELS